MEKQEQYQGDEPKKRRSIVARGEEVTTTLNGEVVNASGHRDQLQRQYSVIGIAGVALSVDNAWITFGSTIGIAILNGGPPGVLYELLTAIFYYAFIAASIAELASAIPSSGGVYHWASITPGPRHGRIFGFFAGYINFFGWLFDCAAAVFFMSEILVQMYAVWHPGFVMASWQVFVTLVLITWGSVLLTIFCNRFLPVIEQFGMLMIIGGGVVCAIVIAAMPSKHASNSFVWSDYQNGTGWNGGVAFLTGVLNGAFTIGTTDAITHMAEELPAPKKDLPRAIAIQLGLGGLAAFLFGIALFYGINDLDAVINSQGSFPLVAVIAQATGSQGATFGILFICVCATLACTVATFLTVSRSWWALARDDAVPFSKVFSRVNEKLSCPVPATVFVGVMTTAFGAIGLGSKAAFGDITGSFIILSTVSYAIPIVGNLMTGRRNMPPGWFNMGKTVGPIVNIISLLFIIFFDVMYCFPYGMPTNVATMNYNSLILVGVVTVTTIWWFIYPVRTYKGPTDAALFAEELKDEQRRTNMS